MKNLTGTEKQITYANDLINSLTEKVERLESKGRGERVKNQRDFLNAVQDGDSAGNIIDVIDNFDFFVTGIESYGITWRNAIEEGAGVKPKK